MSRDFCRQQSLADRWVGAVILAAVVLLCGPAFAGDFLEPQVFESRDGVLDLLMIARAQPIPSISYAKPNSEVTINPMGWVYVVCPMSAALLDNQCPPSAPTVADYGGVRLALQKGDLLKIRLVNRLPFLEPVKVTHSGDPGGGNLPLNLTNLHTHGMIVAARPPTLDDPTFGDYVFVEIYNSTNGTPVPQTTHQHGSLVRDYADYQIRIPSNHPSGLFWFHPHVHGLSLNQVSSGLSGIITVGQAGDNILGDLHGTQFPEQNVRHLILKDLQVIADNPAQQFSRGVAPSFNGEVLNQQDALFCNQLRAKEAPRLGYCNGRAGDDEGRTRQLDRNHTQDEFSGGIYPGGRWFFTVSGQQYPTINITEPDGELWRLTNASGNVTYDLQLIDKVTQQPILMQLASVDGVSVSVPAGTPHGTLLQLGGARFTVVDCPAPGSGGTEPVCISDLVMMPSSRSEVWVIYRNASGQIVTPPAGASATFKTVGVTTGPAGDSWPEVDLAAVKFVPTGPRTVTANALDIQGDARAAYQPGGIFNTAAPQSAASDILPAGCVPLADGHHRRIFFGLPDTGNSSVFGLGYEEVDANGAVVPGTQVPVSSFDPSANTICLPLGPGQMPVRETWELVNLATEAHNFHMHQTKFRLVRPASNPGSALTAATLNPDAGAGILEDNVPLPPATANISDVADNQGGYCTIDQWRNGQCTSDPVVVEIPFSQIGEFVYHCHILAHEDSGMMAKIQVVPSADNLTMDSSGLLWWKRFVAPLPDAMPQP